MTLPRVGVIIASTRPERAGASISAWVVDELDTRTDLNIQVIDLRDVALPLLDEPHHPSEQKYLHSHTRAWSATIDALDAFIVVTPEYNRGMPASLKNAFDYLLAEWEDKPIGFVSYSGGVSGGTRAVEMARSVAGALAMLAIPASVNIARISSHMSGGVFTPPDHATGSVHELADTLVRYARASTTLRRLTNVGAS